MRTLALALIFVSVLGAQRGGGRGGGFRGSGGFGRGPAMSRPGGYNGGGGYYGGGGYRGGYDRGGFTGGYYRGGYAGGRAWYGGGGYYGGYHGGFYQHPVHRAYWRGGYGYYPYGSYGGYAAPFWGVSGIYSPYYAYPYAYDEGPAVTVVAPQSGQPSGSTIIINDDGRVYRRHRDEDERPLRSAEPDRRAPTRANRSPLYLIAAKDGNIRAVIAYWVEKDTLHYITMNNERRQIPLAELDRELSEQFNRERGVQFALP